jgi:putative membrane protein
MLTPVERERLANAIRDAEARTAGEIVVVVAGRASAYRSVPLLWALLGALVVPWPLIAFTDLGPSRLFTIQLAVALALSLALSWLSRRQALVPDFVQRSRAHEAAEREFTARGLARTRGRTGVLIYVAVAEHYAEVLADTGIAEKVDPAIWRTVIADLIDAIKAGRMADGLLRAVTTAGGILAEHAPALADDEDELPNKVIVIENRA